jgi:hypothetical protein
MILAGVEGIQENNVTLSQEQYLEAEAKQVPSFLFSPHSRG